MRGHNIVFIEKITSEFSQKYILSGALSDMLEKKIKKTTTEETDIKKKLLINKAQRFCQE